MTEKTPPEMNLPALLIQVNGAVTTSNLPFYKARALEVIAAIKRDLKTDGDFAEAEGMVKWCSGTEAALADAKMQAQGQMKSVDELFNVIDQIIAETRAVRLELSKLVKDRKDDIRGEIIADGLAKLDGWIDFLNESIGKPYMPKIEADFFGAMKGKKTVESLNVAMNAELARAKCEADRASTDIMFNLGTLRTLAGDHKFLFADAAQIVLKAPDDLTALVKLRIAEHQAAEEKKAEALRESIRKEEQDKLALAQRLTDSEKQEQARQVEIAGAVLQNRAAQELQAEPIAELLPLEIITPAPHALTHAEMINIAKLAFMKGWDMDTLYYSDYMNGMESLTEDVYDFVIECKAIGTVAFDAKYAPAPAAPAPNLPPTLRLGQIAERLGFALTADFLTKLGFAPAGKDRAAVLYHEADFAGICDALVKRIVLAKLAVK